MRLISLLLGVAILAIFVTWNLKLFGTSLEQSTAVLGSPAASEKSIPQDGSRASSPATAPILMPGIEARNTRRKSDVTALLDALFQYSVEHGGMYPEGIGSAPVELCKQGASSCDGLLDLSAALVSDYLAAMPTDPKTGTEGNSTRYAVALEGSRISVRALDAEGGAVITVRR